MGKFKFIETKLKGMFVVEPTVYGDNRGYFMETYNYLDFAEAGFDMKFVQDNQSASSKGVLRGLHFQTKHPQGKLVRVLKGCVFDVGVDIIPGSPTFGQWEGIELSEENKRQLFIPAGFAHGFLVLSEYAEFAYKCTEFYDPSGEGGIIWNDGDLAIDWPDIGCDILLSEKDKANMSFKEYCCGLE